jgi:hypothetical protein
MKAVTSERSHAIRFVAEDEASVFYDLIKQFIEVEKYIKISNLALRFCIHAYDCWDWSWLP